LTCSRSTTRAASTTVLMPIVIMSAGTLRRAGRRMTTCHARRFTTVTHMARSDVRMGSRRAAQPIATTRSAGTAASMCGHSWIAQ